MDKYIKEFVSYFKSGISGNEKIGLELEHFILKDGKRVGYSRGVSEILEILSKTQKKFFQKTEIF